MSSARYVGELSSLLLARRDGHVVVFEIYMDESGIDAGSAVIVAAAYIGTKRSWINFTKSWNRAKGSVKVYHATDAANLRGEFKHWSEPKRNKLVLKLLPVLSSVPILAFTIGYRMDDYREVVAEFPALAASDADIYTTCFQLVIQDVLAFLDRNDDRTNLAFIHETSSFTGKLEHCWNWINTTYAKPGRHMSFAFGTKEGYVPLQAADILAYEANKRMRKPDSPPRRPWPAMNPEGDHRVFRYFDKAALRRWGAEKTRLLEAAT